MPKYRGIDQYIKYNFLHGAALDKICYVVGGEMRDDSEILEVRPLGDWRPQVFTPLGIRSDGSINFVVYEEGILEMAERDANGDLTSFDIEGGIDTHGPSILHEHCKVDTLTLECNANAPLVATLAWKSKYRKDGTAARVAYEADYIMRPKPVIWAGCTPSSPDYGLTNFLADIVGCTITINHNVDWEYTLGAAGDDAVRDRAAKYLRAHQQVVTCDIRTYEEDTYELQGDSVEPAVNLELVYVGERTIRIRLLHLMRGTYTLPNVPNEGTVLTQRYQALDFTIAAV